MTWVSRDEGDGAGYDIRSFNDDGTPRLIEVKTTGLFRFGVSPRLYMLRGALTETCRLEPSQYSARVGR